MKAKHVQTRMHPDSDNITKVTHHASCLVCHYLIERFVLWLNAAISITVTLKKEKKRKPRVRWEWKQAGRLQICWGSASFLGPVSRGWRNQETWGQWMRTNREIIVEICVNNEKEWASSEGWNHSRDPLWPKQDLGAAFTCDQHIRGAGMQQYLCFFMPFFCGTDPLFFWLPPSASASLKLDSDPPSQDSSESKPEEDTRARLEQVWEQSLKLTVPTEIIIKHTAYSCSIPVLLVDTFKQVCVLADSQ